MTKVEIIVCPKCKGAGNHSRHETTCYHKGEYDVIYSDCTACNNSGLVKMTTVVTYAPHIAGRPDLRQ
ncbi:hypothetical protein [Novosphingobium lindaniclasticum]|uniref:Uncharacterized protein n=1 Tax=Novosphingobium lindaniclasticum LE124 TaxID=1096930 RepID=T0IL93_9SPHN|nr:hypothetical protein [Novosphingobium lindaniclasticum]EQB10409.1 hypothetical protein L284_17100 [Novosphingobium lindaniclasticum LE124]